MSNLKVKPFNPLDKSFKVRLTAFLHDVKTKHGIVISTDHGRTPEWAQTMHVCHMFLFNAFNNAIPKYADSDDRTITWAHLSDPAVVWKTVKYEKLLRTKQGSVPEKNGAQWKKGSEPDLAKSTECMQKLMKDWGCAKGPDGYGSAMTACGIKPCGEPCCCSVGVSKHISGLAADLNRDALHRLMARLKKDNAGSLDHLLAAYGLHRPMLHHKKSPEEWHVEAIAVDHVDHSKHPAHHRVHLKKKEDIDLLEHCPHMQA